MAVDYSKLDYDATKKRGFLRSRTEGIFTLRTRKIAGNYTGEQLTILGKIAKEYGRDILHMTTRQGIEIPFIPYEKISEIEAILSDHGINVGNSGPRLRATTSCPGNNWCKRGLVNTFEFSRRLEQEVGILTGMDLPHKFKIVVSGCPNACTRAQCSEIGLHGAVGLVDGQQKIGYVIYLGGRGGRDTRIGFKLDNIFSEDEALELIPKVVHFFKENAKPRQRLSNLIDEYGKDNFLSEIGITPKPNIKSIPIYSIQVYVT